MLFISLIRRRMCIATAFTLLALTLSLVFAPSSRVLAFAAGEQLTQISSDPFTNLTSQHKTEVEPDTFAFGNTIVSAFQVGRFFNGGASDIGFATSTNGGETWSQGFLPGLTVFTGGTYDRTSDPSVAFDARHNVWMVSSLGIHALNGSIISVDVVVSRSTDGGLTWGPPVVVDNAGTTSGAFLDKNWTVCDDTASSPFYGHCYTEFDNFSSINLVQMSTSTDGGLHWLSPKTTPDKACVIGGQPLVQPNGTVIVPIDDCFETAVLSFRSTNGGKSWSKVVLAAQILSSLVSGNLRTGPLPSAEIDRSGKVYVVWQDCRFEPGCSSNDIVMITSSDGLHWALPMPIPIDPIGSGVDHFIPGLAVDRTTADESAHLGLAFYYYPNASCTIATCQLNVGFVSSTNGGNSWSSKEQLAGPMMVTWLADTSQGLMVGDYISTSFVPGDDATPVFAVAQPPTGASSCGLLPVVCHEAMFTTPKDLLQIVGGTNALSNGPTFSPSQQPELIRHSTF